VADFVVYLVMVVEQGISYHLLISVVYGRFQIHSPSVSVFDPSTLESAALIYVHFVHKPGTLYRKTGDPVVLQQEVILTSSLEQANLQHRWIPWQVYWRGS